MKKLVTTIATVAAAAAVAAPVAAAGSSWSSLRPADAYGPTSSTWTSHAPKADVFRVHGKRFFAPRLISQEGGDY